MKKTIIMRVMAILTMVSILFCLSACNQKVHTGEKNITLTIVYEDKTEKKLEISTNAQYLGEVLFEQKLVCEDEYESGFYSKIDGVRADYDLDKAWWCVTKGGQMTTVGINDLAIADGDSFEITHSPA